MREVQLIARCAVVAHAALQVDEALDAMLAAAFEMYAMFGSDRWALREKPRINPLLQLHERLARAVELLLLVRARAAPMLPPEAWAIVVGHVLSTPFTLGCDAPRRATETPRPVLRHYGYAPDGSLRLALDPPLALPRLVDFREGVGALLSALGLSTHPAELARRAEMLGTFGSKSAFDRVRMLIAAFELPVPKHVLGPPAVSIRMSVSHASDAPARSGGGASGLVSGEGKPAEVGVSRFGDALVRVRIDAVALRGFGAVAVYRKA